MLKKLPVGHFQPKHFGWSVDGKVATIALNRPEKKNPLTFDSVEPFIAYTRASLSEDRKLWNSFFQNAEEYEQIIAQITHTAGQWLKRDGKLVMTKVVGGFIATK